MTKELEALEVIRNKFIDFFHEDIPDFDIVEQALQRLETIDNANPSEALKCLEGLNCGLKDDKAIHITLGYFEKAYPTIKQALLKTQEQEEDIIHYKGTVANLRRDNALLKELNAKLRQKAQEPKQYLKWEDLEFTSEDQTIKVKMGDTVYKILYRRCDGIEEVQLLSEDEKLLVLNLIGKYKDNIQVFNDLHLERVE